MPWWIKSTAAIGREDEHKVTYAFMLPKKVMGCWAAKRQLFKLFNLNIFPTNGKKQWAKPDLFSVFFVLFSHHKEKHSTNLTINCKSIDGVLGSQLWGGRMEGADESTELWRHPLVPRFLSFKVNFKILSYKKISQIVLSKSRFSTF